MRNSGIGTIFAIILSIFCSVYVYGDSKKRNMNTLFWTLLVFFIPITILIYFLARKK